MSIVRNTVVLRNAELGALVVLALFECNEFVAVRFGIKGVFCKQNRSNTLYTARVPVHGTYKAIYTAIYTVRHGPYAAVYTARSRPCTQPCTHAYVYTAVTRPCMRHIHGRVHGQYTAMYMGRLHGPSCTWQVGLPGHLRVPRRHATAVWGPSRPCTRPVHGSVYGRVRRPLHGCPTRAYVYTAVKRPCTRHVHVRIHGQYTVVYMAGMPTRPGTRAETAPYGR